MRFWQNLIWAHFLLCKKPGFAGVPPLARPLCAPPEANPQDLRPLAQLRCPPLGDTDCIRVPQGGSMIPMIDTLVTDFELMFSG
jgi:hypothetical protein